MDEIHVRPRIDRDVIALHLVEYSPFATPSQKTARVILGQRANVQIFQ
ncbi:MAG: hypothetical protein WCY32_15805 [Burkholderiaceae bacterium]